MPSIMRSPDGDTTGGAPPAAAPPAAAPPAAPPAGSPAPPAAGNEPAAPSHRDWNAMRADMRAIADELKGARAQAGKEPPKLEPAPSSGNAAVDAALAGIESRFAEADFRDALADAEIKGPHRDALKLMWQGSGRPTQDIAAWIGRHRAMLGAAGPANVQPVPIAVVPPKAPSDTGQPVSATASDGKPTGHPLQWPVDLISKMTPEAYRAAIRDYESHGAGSTAKTYFAARRAAAEERRIKK